MKNFAYIILLVAIPLISMANATHDKLMSLEESDRDKVLGLFLMNSGADCKQVKDTFFQGFDKKKNSYWNIDCGNEKYFLQIQNDTHGTTNVVKCDALKKAGLECFSKTDKT